MKVYNKLVRDKIPEIILKQGKTVAFHALEGNKLKKALEEKLIEETQELINAQTEEEIIEEIVDVTEVLYALQEAYGISYSKVADAFHEKNREKGGFKKGYFLESVSSDRL